MKYIIFYLKINARSVRLPLLYFYSIIEVGIVRLLKAFIP